MWVFPGAKGPFPYEIVEPDGRKYLPDLPVDDNVYSEPEHAAHVLDLEYLVKYIGQPVDIYIQGIKQPDTILIKVEKINDMWMFETT